MSTTSASAGRPGKPPRLPGVYVEDRLPLATGAPELTTGVPAFIGFAEPERSVLARGRVPAVVIDGWNADEFRRLIKPDVDSFLPMAVRGFFANGGKRCVVLAVPPGSSNENFLSILERNGPLEERSDIDLVCVPDASQSDQDGRYPYEVHAAVLEHCEAMGDRFAILDAEDVSPRAAQNVGPDAAQTLVNHLLANASSLRSAFGALYFPWIGSDQARDLVSLAAPPEGRQEWRCLPRPARTGDRGPLQFGPSCGHIAGLYARTDAIVGPQQAPANAILEDVVDTSVHLPAPQYALLNDGGVNCIRSLRGRGIDVLGARTRSGHTALAYISSARVVSGFRRWLEVGMRDLVFEPHSTTLWDRVRDRLESRCLDLLRSGALAGADPAEAFFVKCDSETNPPVEIERGLIVAHVGLAASIPAEFIIVRVAQGANAVTMSSLSEQH
jgi:phage tail sheath protein FI